MKSFLYQFATELRLYYRNRMALLYGYLFPTIFLVAFWVLYRHELVPLVRHMGELLTVTALGGACFGLPTAMVSERERGVWRRYRVSPVSTLQLVLGTLAARYVILISAAVLQLALAVGIGMPLPYHLFALWVAFTFVSFAFLGLGLVIAMLADNVPAVQALGQSIFLPMLIIGGVAVRIDSLPAWAQHLSAFFPGRYAVAALQASVDGPGMSAAWFSLLALLLVGTAGCLAAAKLFRWDARERFVTRGGKAWVGVALAAWIAVGALAEVSGRIRTSDPAPSDVAQAPRRADGGAMDDTTGAARAEVDTVTADRILGGPGEIPSEQAEQDGEAGRASAAADARDAVADVGNGVDAPADAAGPEGEAASGLETPTSDPSEATVARGDAPASGAVDTAGRSSVENPSPRSTAYPSTWRDVTREDVAKHVRFDTLPYDEGLEAPIAALDDPVYPDIESTLECILESLREWPPALVDDPVQRARNVLYVAAVPDMYQMSGLESWIPHAVFDHLRQTYPEAQLVQVLYWIATHPSDGSIAAADRLSDVCLAVGGPSDVPMLQERTGWYAAKLLGRITGYIRPSGAPAGR